MKSPRSTTDNERLQELRLAIQRFTDRRRSSQTAEEADCARATPEEALVCSSRVKRKARATAECPLSPASMAISSGPPGIDASGPTSSGPPGIDASGPMSSDSSCLSRCLLASQPPLGWGVTYFVISLRDSTGEARLSNMGLCARYRVIDGVCPDEVPAHIVAHWNSGRMSLERNRALQGAFAAHVRAWRALLHAGDAGGIALEDDCIFYRPHPLAPMQYPTDAVTLLGGCSRGFGRWCLCENFIHFWQHFLKHDRSADNRHV